MGSHRRALDSNRTFMRVYTFWGRYFRPTVTLLTILKVADDRQEDGCFVLRGTAPWEEGFK